MGFSGQVQSESLGSDAGATARGGFGSPALAALWLVVWTASLSRSLFDPIGFDQAAWQYATERVMAGQRMYVDVWDQNAPGVIGVHWLSTVLVGRSPLALRVFDAIWQLATMGLLVSLAARDGRRSSVGWLAAALYALAYYGTGYVHTAQRDGFAVLPMLLMLHAAVDAVRAGGKGRSLGMGLVAGVMGFAVFAIKPPLGLCYGAVWIFFLSEVWRRRIDGRLLAGWLGLTAGFLVAAAAGIAWMMHLGWWSAFVQTMTRSDIPGYTKGPWMVRQLLPTVGMAMVLMAAIAVAVRGGKASSQTKIEVGRLPEGVGLWLVGVFVCVVMLTVVQWTEWQPIALGLAGLWVPAVGSVLVCTWAGRSVAWRLVMLTAVASAASIVFQGRFFLYHFHPLIACASWLAAVEIVDACTRRGRETVAESGGRSGAWRAVCLGMTAYLVIGFWGSRMVFYCSSPCVLKDATLMEHYDRVTRHKSHYPLYSTSVRVAERVRELTEPDEAIACLLNEPRIYYLAERPAAHGMIIPNEAFQPKFDGFIRTICEKRPPVLLARRPKGLSAPADMAALTSSIWEEAEAFFGAAARSLRGEYQATEVVDDVCILRPIKPWAAQ